MPRDPDHVDDSLYYHQYAISIADGKGYVDPFKGSVTAAWPPGYPFFLGSAYKAFGDSAWTAKWLNVLLGTATVGLLGVAARKHLGDRAGLLAAGGLAAYPAHIYFTVMVMTEIPFTFLLVLAYFLIVHQPAALRSATMLGVVAGAGILMRGEALLLPAAYGGYWLAQRRSIRRAAVLTIVSGLVAAACVAPWTYRNYRVMHAFVPINTSASDALWTGHYADATGGITFDHLKLSPEEEVQLGPKKAEVESSSRRQSAVLRFMREHPRDELELIPRKLLYLFSGDANAMIWVQATTSGGPVLSAIQVQLLGVAADFYYYTLMSASLAGAVFAWRRQQRPGAALAFIAGIVAIFLFMHGWLTYGDARYRLPMMPFLIVLAAASIDDVWRALSQAGDAPRLT